MSENPYQTPQGELIYQENPSEAAGFYVVSKMKMILLFIFTAGIYQLYWFYRNWRLHKMASGEKIWPVARAIFAIFFVHSLFRMASASRDRQSPGLPAWNHGPLATIIVILLILSHILDRLASKSVGSPVTDLLGMLILLPVVACFASAQERINEACRDPRGESNSKLTVANYVWMVLGVLIWGLALYGTFFMPLEEI